MFGDMRPHKIGDKTSLAARKVIALLPLCFLMKVLLAHLMRAMHVPLL